MAPIVRRIALGLAGVWLALALGSARADDLEDAFDTVWESLWFQGGSAEQISRWEGPIRARVHGRNAAWHRERIIEALQRVGRAAGVEVQDLSDAADAAARANLDIEVVDDLSLADNMACFVRETEVTGSVIRKSQMRLRQSAVYDCILHEAMHVMGIVGHPRLNTILSYFARRVDRLSELDLLLLKAWYSPAMKAGMTPLEALPVLTDAVVAAARDVDPARAREAQRRYHAQVIRQVEAFALDEGELPLILKRSGTASPAGMARGRLLMRAFLGLAYARGTMVVADPRQSLRWMERAARDRLPYAQWMMGVYAERGYGREVSAADAYVWYGRAAAQGLTSAGPAQKRVASVMTPEEVEAAQQRIAAPP